jgi:uncharacterized pyridoxal phosphate-containing UPF0001 family protein
MTIGRQSQPITPNPDFMKLVWCREVLCQQLNCAELELSMGMTDDYQHAVSCPLTFLLVFVSAVHKSVMGVISSNATAIVTSFQMK